MLPVNSGGHTAYQTFVLENLRKYYPDPTVLLNQHGTSSNVSGISIFLIPMNCSAANTLSLVQNQGLLPFLNGLEFNFPIHQLSRYPIPLPPAVHYNIHSIFTHKKGCRD